MGKPEGPPPMPKHLSLQPTLVTDRSFAPSAMAAAPGLHLLLSLVETDNSLQYGKPANFRYPSL